MPRIVVALMGLVCGLSSLAFGAQRNTSQHAAAVEQFAGGWLIVSALAPQAPRVGSIPRAYILSQKDGRLQGVYRWGGDESALSGIAVNEGMLIFKLKTLYGMEGRTAQISKDGQQLQL